MDRIYVNVEYKEKDNAKSKGAKWDAENKLWYFITNVKIVDNKLNGYEVIDKNNVCCICLNNGVKLEVIHDNHKCCKDCIKKIDKCPLCREAKNNEKRERLYISYYDRERAKSCGAKWDGMSWYKHITS